MRRFKSPLVDEETDAETIAEGWIVEGLNPTDGKKERTGQFVVAGHPYPQIGRTYRLGLGEATTRVFVTEWGPETGYKFVEFHSPATQSRQSRSDTTPHA